MGILFEGQEQIEQGQEGIQAGTRELVQFEVVVPTPLYLDIAGGPCNGIARGAHDRYARQVGEFQQTTAQPWPDDVLNFINNEQLHTALLKVELEELQVILFITRRRDGATS